VGAGQPGGGERLDVGKEADPDDDQVGRQDAAVGERDRADVAVGAVDRVHPGREVHVDPLGAVHAEEEVGDHRRRDAGEQPFLRLDQGDGDPALAEDRRGLQPDVAAADDDRAAGRGHRTPQPVGVVERADAEDAAEAGARQSQLPC
jgi:hypothetical protein